MLLDREVAKKLSDKAEKFFDREIKMNFKDRDSLAEARTKALLFCGIVIAKVSRIDKKYSDKHIAYGIAEELRRKIMESFEEQIRIDMLEKEVREKMSYIG